jgi:hypothetical protein
MVCEYDAPLILDAGLVSFLLLTAAARYRMF